jgi:hypothetical protein
MANNMNFSTAALPFAFPVKLLSPFEYAIKFLDSKNGPQTSSPEKSTQTQAIYFTNLLQTHSIPS